MTTIGVVSISFWLAPLIEYLHSPHLAPYFLVHSIANLVASVDEKARMCKRDLGGILKELDVAVATAP